MSKKYDLPIEKPKMVEMPRWEYRDLIRSDTMMAVVEKLVNDMDSYLAWPVLKLMFAEEDAKE